MTPFQEGNSMFYNVTLKMKKMKYMLRLIIIKMVKTKEIAYIATSHFSKESEDFFYTTTFPI